MQDVADIRKQFPLLKGDIKFPEFFKEEQFFSSVFRISSPGLQLWTHYDVCYINEKFKATIDLLHYRFNSQFQLPIGYPKDLCNSLKHDF